MSLSEAQIPFDGLTPDLILAAIESIGYLTDGRILALNSYENRVYQVGIDDSAADETGADKKAPLIAKFYRPQRWSDAQILEEHQFTQELADQELPVVPPIAMDGQTLFRYQNYRFSLCPRKGGHAPELDNLDHLLVLGRLLGRIHAVGGTQHFQHRQCLNINIAKENVDFLHENFMPAELKIPYYTLCEDVIGKITAVFSQVGEVPTIRLHGDCHIGNILWRDNNAHFVDFDDAITGPAIQDLWMFLSGERDYRLSQIAEIADGYNEFNDFPTQQLGLIEALRSLRIINYSAWLAKRWHDPAFPMNFPWFNSERFWSEHILELREQLAAMDEEPLQLF